MNDLKICFKRVDYDLSGLLHYLDRRYRSSWHSASVRLQKCQGSRPVRLDVSRDQPTGRSCLLAAATVNPSSCSRLQPSPPLIAAVFFRRLVVHKPCACLVSRRTGQNRGAVLALSSSA